MNILRFSSYTVSLTTTQICNYIIKWVKDSKQQMGKNGHTCVLIQLYFKKIIKHVDPYLAFGPQFG